MSSGNGGDNAHNNQFGGGGRGPTGGVNMGSGSPGNAGDRGNGYYSYDPSQPKTTGYKDGQVLIEVIAGHNWVSDNSIHWSDGKSGNEGRDNLRTNVVAPVPSGFRSAVDGYIYTVTVDGNDNITSVSLYSRPVFNSRKDWKKGETSRQAQARALVQVQLNAKKATAAAAAKKAAEAAAAAEAKRKAEEEAKRKQAEWDAAHPVEAAQRDANTAKSTADKASANLTTARNALNNANSLVSQRQSAYNQAVAAEEVKRKEYAKTDPYAPPTTPPGMYAQAKASEWAAAKKVTADKKAQLDAAVSQRIPIQKNFNTAQAQANSANAAKSAADTRLSKALADAAAKRKAEAARQAAETARVKALQEAEAKAKAQAEEKAKSEADAATKAAAIEAARSKLEEPNVFGFAGFPATVASSAPITFAETGLGGFTLGEAVAATAWNSVRTVVAELVGAVVSGSGIGALIASIAYVPSAGEGSDNVPGREDINMFLSAMPADAIKLPSDADLSAAANVNGAVDMAVRGRLYYSENVLKTYLVRTVNPSAVRVLNASIDKVTGLYSVSIPAESGLPSRTILVSPERAPSFKGLPPLVTPSHSDAVPGNTGNQNPVYTSPVIESFPMADDMDFRDAILIFPADSGLQPIYVMLQSGRDLPGTVEGKGADIAGLWLGSADKELGAPVPTRIANKLAGKEFRNFDAFRDAFWKEVAADSELAVQFNTNNRLRMKKGLAPRVHQEESVGGRLSFEIHHIELISQGGEVYDIDNLRILTPKRHIEIHSKK